MKKFLLSLAAVACAASMSATSYTLYSSDNRGTWTGDGNGYNTTVTAGGKSFQIAYNKGGYNNDLLSPADKASWRFYKNSEMTITSSDVNMKQVIVTFDNYEYNGTTYYATLSVSEGWTGTLKDLVFTAVNASGSKTITMSPQEKQVRIVSIVVSDEEGAITPPVTPDLPEGVIYQNSFEENLDDWDKSKDSDVSNFKGWTVNTKDPKCAICNAYNGSVFAANAKMQKTFDLTGYTDVEMSFEQAFGYDFPQSQNDNYRVYVISGGNTEYLTMANFPAAPASGNWTKEWPVNTFDLSEYDGTQLTIGFEYANDGSISRAWEIRNFILKGNGTGNGIAGVEADENVAPVYYNLQGVRVNNPENGLFIVVKGSEVSKVIL